MEDACAPLPTAALSPASHPDVKPTTESIATKPANALTPPTSEEMNHDEPKQEEESELSDLELDEEDEEIFPDHYWDGDNGGRIPVFKPTMDQFRSFKKFIDKIDRYGMKSGIVKVIPPPEWRANLPALQEYVKRIRIKNPITQEFNGVQGTYTQQNVEKQRSYNLPEWKALCEETQHQPPAKRGERRRNQTQVVRGGGARSRNATAAKDDGGDQTAKKNPTRSSKRTAGSAEGLDPDVETSGGRSNSRAQAPATPDPPATKVDKAGKKKAARRSGKAGGGQAKSVTSRRLNNTAETADYIDEVAFKDFEYRMDGLDEFTPERCQELEAHYWKSLGFNQPMYAADMPGSLFDDSVSSWNVAKLENLLDVLGTKVPGVNTAYLYMGMWKATFAWHLEDVDLYSINYIHFGAPKHWYSISQEDARRFEAAMRNVWPGDAKNCDQFLRHKTYLISPDVLQKQYNVKVNKLVHYEGEFVITYPYGYHSGFNLGYNCAESVNFATESWLDYGRIARKCNCEADNVWVDVGEIERKLRGEPTPEYYEETDDDDEDGDDAEAGNLPSPPASVKAPRKTTKKRKRDVKEEAPKKKKKIRIRIKVPTREPCVLCPNDPLYEPLLTTDTGKKAHRSCALYTPETWISVEDDKEKVYGVTTIDRARLELKCNFCRSKRGACFQCSSKKCTRAFHATCALAAGVQVDCGPVPTFGEDGTEYFEEGYDFRCKFHRPKMPKTLNLDTLETSKRIINFAKTIKAGDVVQAQYVGGEAFAGHVVENRPTEMSVLVNVLPDGDQVEIEWKWLCVLDPDDSLRPQPSLNAIPMPKGMNKKTVSIGNRQDGVPSQDEPFHDNPEYKWANFYNIDLVPPGYGLVKHTAPTKLNVEIDAADQLYHYLPLISTDAKCFFTDTPGGTTHVAKSNFLDRVNPRPVYQPPAQRTTFTPIYPGMASYRPFIPGSSSNASKGGKPYAYKPKEPAQPSSMMIDHQALANQRSFANQADRQGQTSTDGTKQVGSSAYYDPARNTTQLKPFPADQYYSIQKLPAAVPGEYSQYRNEVRRQSQGAQNLQKPIMSAADLPAECPFAADQRTAIQRNSDALDQQRPSLHSPVVGGFAGNPGSRPVTSISAGLQRMSSASQAQQSPIGTAMTPVSTGSSTTNAVPIEAAPTDPGYIENLKKYRYLFQIYCRRPRVYESPYPVGGGFSKSWAPHSATEDDQTDAVSHQSPYCSTSPADQWTPPSQVYSALNPTNTAPPPAPMESLPQPAGAKRPLPVHMSASDFQQSIVGQPSVADREGRHLRAMRNSITSVAQNPYSTPTQPHGGLAQQYDVPRMWQSPSAPTPSPLTDQNTPYAPAFGPSPPTGTKQPWKTPSQTEPTSANGDIPLQPSNSGYGPTLPQMGQAGGSETWRYSQAWKP